MSQAYDAPMIAAQTSADARALFLRRVYAHLAGSILAFIALEAVLLQLPHIDNVVHMMAGSQIGWLVVLGGFMGVSMLAQMWARSDTSVGMQYLGLTLYVVAEAIIFLPLLWMASRFDAVEHTNNIMTAAIMTLSIFGGLTLAVLLTGKDYSHIGPYIAIGSMIALGFIVAACLFGFSLGLWFSLAMVALISATILYQTSNVLHHYRTDQHVAAALALFAAVAILFWYILQIVMESNRR